MNGSISWMSLLGPERVIMTSMRCALLAAGAALVVGCAVDNEQDTGPVSYVHFGTSECTIKGCPLDGPVAVGTRATVGVRGLSIGVEHTVTSTSPAIIAVEAGPDDLTESLQLVPCLFVDCNPHFELHALAAGSSDIRLNNDRGIRAHVALEARRATGVAVRIWRQLGDDEQERVLPESDEDGAPFVLAPGDLAYVGSDLLDDGGTPLIGLGGLGFASSNELVLSVSDASTGVTLLAEVPGAAKLVATTPDASVSFEFEVRLGR